MKKIIKYVLMGMVIFTVFFAGGTWLTKALLPSDHIADGEEDRVEDQDGERTNILVLGVDARSGDNNSRSDVMILASIDPELDKIALISIPRDTRVNINANHVDKMGTANFYGGPELVVKIVEGLMNIHIDHYVEMDFNGFKEIVDAVGGVTVDVPQRMYKPSEDIDLQPGVQVLHGKEALAYVRYRDYAQGDIERVQVQQSFLKDLAKEVLSPASIVKIPTFVQIAHKNVVTDMGLRDMLRIAAWAPSFKVDSIIAQTLPGYFYDERDGYGNLTASFWVADKTVASSLLNTLFSGQQVATMVQMETVTNVVGPPVAPPKKADEQEPSEPTTPTKGTEDGNQDTGSVTGSASDIQEELDFTLNTEDVSGDPAGSDNFEVPVVQDPVTPEVEPVDNLDLEPADTTPSISPEELEWQQQRAQANT